MLKFRHSRLSKKDYNTINLSMSEIADDFREFFVTRNNKQLFLQSNPELLMNNVAKGDYLIYDTEENGVLLVTGYSDNYNRKYVKILAKSNAIIYNLLKMLLWNTKEDLYIKINKRNPIIKIFQEFGFIFLGGRGKLILLKRSKDYVFIDNN